VLRTSPEPDCTEHDISVVFQLHLFERQKRVLPDSVCQDFCKNMENDWFYERKLIHEAWTAQNDLSDIRSIETKKNTDGKPIKLEKK